MGGGLDEGARSRTSSPYTEWGDGRREERERMAARAIMAERGEAWGSERETGGRAG